MQTMNCEYKCEGEGDLLGAGSFGIVHGFQQRAYKRLYEPSRSAVQHEIVLQSEAHRLLEGIVRVPVVYESTDAGFWMDRVPIPEGFTETVHMILGYSQDDVDTVWGRDCRQPVGPHNPPRGFHAGTEMMKAVWSDEGSRWTVDAAAHLMGLAMSTLIQNGIHPFDAEFLYGDGEIWMIDFGLCRSTGMSRDQFFENRSSDGLFTSYYVPKKCMEGYEAFCEGYWD